MQVHLYIRAFDSHAEALQREQLTTYYSKHLCSLGYVLGGEHIDRASSGQFAWLRRHGGQRCSVLATRGDIILVAKLSVAFRNVADYVESMRLLRAKGVQLLVSELPLLKFGMLEGAEPAFRLMHAAALLAELQADGEVERFRRAIHSRKAWGGHVGYPPLGYMFEGPRGRRRLVEDPLDQKWIARILELKAQGLGSRDIYYQLVREGATRRTGRGWTQTGVAKILVRDNTSQGSPEKVPAIKHCPPSQTCPSQETHYVDRDPCPHDRRILAEPA